MRRDIVIGTRGSELALWQANFVKAGIAAAYPDVGLEIKIIKTTGDKIMDIALSKIGDKGLFTEQIESELLSGGIDLAVHSLKDLQTAQPEGLKIGAVCKRELPNDVLISKRYSSIGELPNGAKVATGSLRRKSQLLNRRPDLEIAEIRGNVPTRLKKFEESDLDAMVLAYAGLHRLGLDEHFKEIVPFDILLPAAGQGAVAVETRIGDQEIDELVKVLDDEVTRACVVAERAFLRRLEGGCQVPIGTLGRIDDGLLKLDGMVGSRDGRINLRERIEGGPASGEEMGIRLAEILIERGAAEILDEARFESARSAETVI